MIYIEKPKFHGSAHFCSKTTNLQLGSKVHGPEKTVVPICCDNHYTFSMLLVNYKIYIL